MTAGQRASAWFKLGWLWLGLTLAFAVYHSGGSLWHARWPGQIICPEAPESAFICAAFQEKLVTVGIACAGSLLLHEGGHWLAARNSGARPLVVSGAAWWLATLGLAVAGLFVAGPTVAWAGDDLTRRQRGQLAMAGPAVSLAASAGFFATLAALILTRAEAPAWFPYFGYVGFRLNALLGLSSMIPLKHFDGASILGWRPAAFAGLSLAAATLTFGLGNEQVLQWLLQLFIS